MTVKIIAIGDSLTQGYPFTKEYSWVNILAKEQGWDIHNRGRNGETTSEILARFPQDVIDAKAKVVIITGGANDVYQQEPLQVILNNYRAMIEMAKIHNIVPVLGITLPMSPKVLEECLQTLRVELTRLARQYNLENINFYEALVDNSSGEIASKWDHDGVHPNPDGYRRMAEVAKPLISHLLEQLALQKEISPGYYRHYKGNMYHVIGVAKHSETLDDLVVYRALYGEKGLWVRPKEMFLESIKHNGNIVQRFEFLKPAD